MRFCRIYLLPLLCSVCIVFPGLSFSEMKLSLRNGREIIADRCRDSNGKLLCEMMGGQFEIEKKDVTNLKEITGRLLMISPEPEAGVSGEKQLSDEKSAGEAAGEDKKAVSQKRLDEINARKRELIAEREGLTKEREKLNAEFRGEGDVLSPAVFDSYQKRFDEIEAKINSFNQENRKLNEEERVILQEMGRNAEGMK